MLSAGEVGPGKPCPVLGLPVQEVCAGIKQVPWRVLKMAKDGDGCSTKKVWGAGSPLCLSSTLRSFFCLLSHVPPRSQKGHTCRATSTHPQCLLHLLLLHSIIHQDHCGLSSRSIQSHSRPIAGPPFRSSFQVPAHRWMRSYPHCPKPQLRYDSKVTNKCGGHRLNFPGVGEPQREISNCESRG